MNTYWNMLYLERPPYATCSVKSSPETGMLSYCVEHVVEHVHV